MATTEQFALPRERSNSFETYKPSDVRPSEPWLDKKEEKHHMRDDDENNGKTYDMDEHYEDEDGEPVDPSVREDMKRLEDTFTGISKRFRLINRIGEGGFYKTFYSFPALTSISIRHLFNRVQSRGYTVRSLPERLGLRGRDGPRQRMEGLKETPPG